MVSGSCALPPRWPPQCSCVVIESSFDPGERLQAPGSLWFKSLKNLSNYFILLAWYMYISCIIDDTSTSHTRVHLSQYKRVRVMVLDATFNNISVISRWSVLLLEKTTDLPQVIDKLYHIMYQLHHACVGFELTTLVLIGTDCIGSCKSNYHMIATTTAQTTLWEL